jgi:hypothetical protein
MLEHYGTEQTKFEYVHPSATHIVSSINEEQVETFNDLQDDETQKQ